MPIDPNIPLSVRGVDLGKIIQQGMQMYAFRQRAEESKRRRELLDLQAKQQKMGKMAEFTEKYLTIDDEAISRMSAEAETSEFGGLGVDPLTQGRSLANEQYQKDLPQFLKYLGIAPDDMEKEGIPRTYDREGFKQYHAMFTKQWQTLTAAEAQAKGYQPDTVVQEGPGGQQKVMQGPPDPTKSVKAQTDFGKLTADYRNSLLHSDPKENERIYQEQLAKVDLGGLSRKELAKLAEEQGDNYFNASKDFTKVRDAYARIQASATPATPAGDLSLIFNYMKMLDPGSTVREGEFQTAAASGSFGDRIKGYVNRIAEGTRLSDPQRKDFVSRSKGLMKAAQKTQDLRKASFTRIAKRAGVDPLDVIERVVADAAREQADAGIPGAAGQSPGEEAPGEEALNIAASREEAEAGQPYKAPDGSTRRRSR